MEEKVTFSSLKLDPDILKALDEAGYVEPTDIQVQAIPHVLEGRDILASAQTGTGKTAAFGLPLLQRMATGEEIKGKRRPRALILSPTRELALQIKENLTVYSKHLPLNVLTVYGGTPINKQINALKKSIDVVVATPGRLLDLIERKAIDLRMVEYFVLDEADRMFDMGFVHDVRKIASKLPKKPNNPQALLFSATLSDEVQSLAGSILKDPIRVSVAAVNQVADNIQQKLYFVEMRDKRDLMMYLLKDDSIERGLVFTATKGNANVLANILTKKGIAAEAIHSDKSQSVRQKALKAFDNRELRLLIATDVLARGIDVDALSHVINYDLPSDPESYVHRIGRTARAGESGVAISLCDMNEVSALQAIERSTKIPFEVITDHPYHSPLAQTMKKQGEGLSLGRRGRGGIRR